MSTASTGGLGNSIVATGETGGSLLALVVPILFGVLVIVGLVALAICLSKTIRERKYRQESPAEAPQRFDSDK